jgi:hypothetical protein
VRGGAGMEYQDEFEQLIDMISKGVFTADVAP